MRSGPPSRLALALPLRLCYATSVETDSIIGRHISTARHRPCHPAPRWVSQAAYCSRARVAQYLNAGMARDDALSGGAGGQDPALTSSRKGSKGITEKSARTAAGTAAATTHLPAGRSRAGWPPPQPMSEPRHPSQSVGEARCGSPGYDIVCVDDSEDELQLEDQAARYVGGCRGCVAPCGVHLCVNMLRALQCASSGRAGGGRRLRRWDGGLSHAACADEGPLRKEEGNQRQVRVGVCGWVSVGLPTAGRVSLSAESQRLFCPPQRRRWGRRCRCGR